MSKSEFGKTVQKLNEQRGDVVLMPCRRCDEPTPRETLSNYGARCFRCYEAYCGEPQPPAKATGRKVPNVMRDRDVAFDPAVLDAAKREQERRVKEYASRRGLAL